MDNFLLPIVIILLCMGAIINKKLMLISHPFTVQWMQSSISVIALPFWYYLAKKYATEAFSWTTYAYALLGSLISSVAYLLFLTAIRTRPVSVAAAYLSVYPALTMLICSGLGLEKLNWGRVIGIICIMLGVGILQIWD